MRFKTLIFCAALLLALPAWADGSQPLAADFCTPVGETIPGTVVDIGMSCANSWRGSGQYIRNMQQFSTPAPSDSGSEASCGIVLGGSDLTFNSKDPVIIGTPGHTGGYILFDGASYLSWPDEGSIFNDSWGKSTGFHDFTVELTLAPVANGTLQSILATKYAGCSGGNYRGVNLWIDTSNHVNYTQCGDTGPASSVVSAVTLQTGLVYFIAAGRSGTTTKLWIGSATPESFTQIYDPTSSSPTGRIVIGSMAAGQSNFLANGTKLYDFQTFNVLLDNTAIASDISILQARDGIAALTH